MDKKEMRKWCFYYIMSPGLAILGALLTIFGLKFLSSRFQHQIPGPTCHMPPLPAQSLSLAEGPTCHMPAFPGPSDPDWWFHSPLGIIILATIGIGIVTGAVLLYKRMNRNKALKNQYEKGIISEEDYQKLK